MLKKKKKPNGKCAKIRAKRQPKPMEWNKSKNYYYYFLSKRKCKKGKYIEIKSKSEQRTDRNELKGVWLRPKNDFEHNFFWIENEIWRETDKF